MNNVIGENNQLLSYWQKYEFSILLFKFWPPLIKKDLICWLISMPGPTPHLLNRWNWALQPELDLLMNTLF